MMTHQEAIKSLPLPDELCWLVQSYLSSTPADAIREFNEELDKCSGFSKNFTGGYFLVDNTIWGKLRKVKNRKLWKWLDFVSNKKYSVENDGKDKFKGWDKGITKLYGVIDLPTEGSLLYYNSPSASFSAVYKEEVRECYEKVNIKTLRQLCKDNKITVKGRAKKDVYKALMKN
jgi:hypothetical protein